MSRSKIIKNIVSKELVSRGARLELWWKSTGWSKVEFAQRMEIKPQNVNGYFSGKIDPTNLVENLMRNGVDIVWLIDGKTSKQIADEDITRKIEALKKQMAEIKEENELLRSYLSPQIIESVLSKLKQKK